MYLNTLLVNEFLCKFNLFKLILQKKKEKKTLPRNLQPASPPMLVCVVWAVGITFLSMLCEMGCFVIQMCSLEELTRYLQSYQVQN